MSETNEEVIQKLKESIHDYYMGFVKQKFKNLLANGKEAEISNQILQFLDAQIDTGNSTIVKDDIIGILNSVLGTDSFNASLEQSLIPYCFPSVADIKIENGGAAYLTEKIQTPFDGIKENSYYLYVSPDYYNDNIGSIESEIKSLEKSFSRKDLKDFEEKFKKDLSAKQYDLESAKVYESVSNQIDLKKQKFNSVSQKMINDYGKKYHEITSKDISDDEKKELLDNLLNDTKSYDEKNHQAVLRLNSEYENLIQNFQGKVQSLETIYSQMQNLHLFDKNRYYEDMKVSIKPELRDLYKKRYLLNSYRLKHNEIVHTGKQNSFADFANNILNKLKGSSSVPLLGPHFERDLPAQNTVSDNSNEVDKNLIKALANFYSKDVLDNKLEFEDYLNSYFKKNYNKLINNSFSKFLDDFTKFPNDNNVSDFDSGDLFKIAKFFEIDDKYFENCTKSNLNVQDGLVYEASSNGLNVIYATDKAINSITNDLYSNYLYHKHLVAVNNLFANQAANLQHDFIDYANTNGIELENNFVSSKSQKRFVKKKVVSDNQNNVIDFKTQSF